LKRRAIMQEQSDARDLNERLALIEDMIAEGRRCTESWGWFFILWGVAFYLAIGLGATRVGVWAVPATMALAAIATVAIGRAMRGERPRPLLWRAVGSIWMALGITMFVIFLPLGISGRLGDPHVSAAVAMGILGLANFASGRILRWRAQQASAVVWWAATAAECFGSERQILIIFLTATFICQIAFGIYTMTLRAGARRRSGTAHA
jgi:hypothetical protein